MIDKVHKVYEPHPALKELVNNITIQKVELDPFQPLPVFLMPSIQERCFANALYIDVALWNYFKGKKRHYLGC
jgi:hypothetical protein